MLPVKRTAPAQNAALEAVLARLIGPQPDRADTPDDWITAVRRQPAVEGEFAAFPESVDARLRQVLMARGIDQLYCHQAPNGWPATGAAWINTGAILNRINLGILVASGRVPGGRLRDWPPSQRNCSRGHAPCCGSIGWLERLAPGPVKPL